jgi:hypothetical protein
MPIPEVSRSPSTLLVDPSNLTLLPETVWDESTRRIRGIRARTDKIGHHDRQFFDDFIAEHDATGLLGGLIVGRENHCVTEMLRKPESSSRYVSWDAQTGQRGCLASG